MSNVSMRRVASASYIGAVIEWYDFFLYGTASALVFNKLFFPDLDPLLGTLIAFATLGAGFLARPLGAFIFGHYGDRIGRKKILIITLLVMGGATFLIGLLPTYEMIGIWAPISLVSLRIVQGIAFGGEYGGATLLTLEYSPRNKRGFWGGLISGSVSAGMVLSIGVFALVSLLPEEQFLSWGWRIPFLISIALLLLGIFIRQKIEETPAFKKVQEDKQVAKLPIVELFKCYPKSLLTTFGLRVAESVSANIVNTFTIAYITTQLGLPRQAAMYGVIIAGVLAIFLSPMFGALSDRIGRRPIYMFSAIFLAAFIFPYFYILNTEITWLMWLGIILIYIFGSTVMLSVQPVIFTELYGTRVRYSALSIVYQVSSIIGGFTPFIALYLLQQNDGKPWLVAIFTVAVCIITISACFFTKETLHEDVQEMEDRLERENSKDNGINVQTTLASEK